MTASNVTALSWIDFSTIQDPSVKPLPYLFTALMFVTIVYSLQGSKSNVPLQNPKKFLEFTYSRPKQEFIKDARKILETWFQNHPEKPVRLINDTGIITILPPKFATEIRNDKRLDFGKWTYEAFHADLPGFEPFGITNDDSRVVQAVIQKDLTKHLNKITAPLSEETRMALTRDFTDNKEWHIIPLKESILNLVAQISSRVFLGEELCRNETWLKITKEYTVVGFRAAYDLRRWSSLMRPIVCRFLPQCQRTRKLLQEAYSVIEPVLEKRRQLKFAAQAGAKDAVEFEDAIEWFEQEAKGAPYNPVFAQLMLSVAAIHTTTDLICQVITDVAKHPEIIPDLRKEIITALARGEMKKDSLYNMKLLDSVIKESQRMKPIGIATMHRLVLEDVKLSDGTILPKGEEVAVSSHRMWDEEVHDSPDQWDGYRFYKMRQKAGMETHALLVSTSPDHLAFGHGRHGCPGRFFAANEVKIAMVHILLKYDWRIPTDQKSTPTYFGLSSNTDSEMKIEVKRRQAEIQL